MKLDDLLTKPLSEVLAGCSVTKLTPIAADDGKIIKLIVEYTPGVYEDANKGRYIL